MPHGNHMHATCESYVPHMNIQSKMQYLQTQNIPDTVFSPLDP